VRVVPALICALKDLNKKVHGQLVGIPFAVEPGREFWEIIPSAR